MSLPSCVFCAIIAGQSPASLVYEDDQVVAFMDTRPVNSGHVLVVPRFHASLVAGLPAGTAAHLFEVAVHLVTAVRRCGVPCEDVNLYVADGPAAGQEVPHVHLHILPRFRADGFGLRFGPSYGNRPERGDLDAVAAAIRAARAE